MFQNRRFPVFGSFNNVAPLVDKSRNAGIGRARNAPSALDGPEFGVDKMLSVAGRCAPPSIVGDNKKNKVGTIAHKFARKFTINRFVTDYGANF